ncbi:hypothetical protein RhiTH_011492 [Rhizoctonia solani]
MSRQLHSGRSYNASKEPQVPKQKMRQCKAAGAKANANEQALETNDMGYDNMIADAPKEGEAAIPRNAEAAVRVPGEQELTPRGTNRAPAAIRAPETPLTTTRRKDTSLDNNVEGELLLAQYIVNDNTSKTPSASSEQRKRRRRKSKGNTRDLIGSSSNESKSTANYEGLTWDEEVQRVNGKDPGGPNTSLPDISKWVNPDWSRLDYIPKSNEQSAGTNGESVQVNALIFKVDENYVYNNNKYAQVLRNLRNQDWSKSTHSQSQGAGPLQARQTHQVTVEEINKETKATETSQTRSYVGKGKCKKKPRERGKKCKQPSLGMALDNLERLQGERVQPTDSREPLVMYWGGGYLEGLISPLPAQPTMNAENNQETIPRGDRGRARDKPTTHSRRTNPPLSTVELLVPLHGQGGDGERPHTGTPRRTTRQQASRKLEDIVRKLRKQNKQLEKKIVTQARSGYKAQTPKAYKGKADIDKYNMFIFNYKLYLLDTKLSNCKAVLTVSQFLEDKAATWYMMNVAPDPEAYTMETIYIGLYKYCFPPDFKEEVQHQYNQKQQGDLSVQDYFAKLLYTTVRWVS